MAFGIFIIGDEILSGKRVDGHFSKVRSLFEQRGLQLSWVNYLGDEPARLVDAFRRSFASGDHVLSYGGIGATPDDHTRACVASALGLPLVAHAEAQALITERVRISNQPLTDSRLRMGEFPFGSSLIPNPYNRIPGFAIQQHWFFPGFPEMAWPMTEWVLDTHYQHQFHQQVIHEFSRLVKGISEGELTPLLESIETDYPGVRTFSLPRLNPECRKTLETEVGVKGITQVDVEAAFSILNAGIDALMAEL